MRPTEHRIGRTRGPAVLGPRSPGWPDRTPSSACQRHIQRPTAPSSSSSANSSVTMPLNQSKRWRTSLHLANKIRTVHPIVWVTQRAGAPWSQPHSRQRPQQRPTGSGCGPGYSWLSLLTLRLCILNSVHSSQEPLVLGDLAHHRAGQDADEIKPEMSLKEGLMADLGEAQRWDIV